MTNCDCSTVDEKRIIWLIHEQSVATGSPQKGCAIPWATDFPMARTDDCCQQNIVFSQIFMRHGTMLVNKFAKLGWREPDYKVQTVEDTLLWPWEMCTHGIGNHASIEANCCLHNVSLLVFKMISWNYGDFCFPQMPNMKVSDDFLTLYESIFINCEVEPRLNPVPVVIHAVAPTE